MSGEDRVLCVADYPLAEKRPDLVRSQTGRALSEITFEAVLDGRVTMEDLRISAQALRDQAAIARAAGRPTLAENFERAADLVSVPQDVVMATYELLRPGRARSKAELLAAATRLREEYGAAAMAAFIEEAAAVYEARGLFRYRF
jgi:propanediol dehydratase small subunit